MKKILYLFLVFKCLYSIGQNDLSNFVDSSNVWYNYGGSFPMNGQYMQYHRFYFYQGDTTIGSQTYKKMFKQVRDSVFSTNTSPYQMNYPLHYEAAFRQEGKKVYFVQLDSLIEKLYIDFDMQVGDTVEYFSFGNSIKTVTSIDSIPFGNQHRKRFSTTGGIIYEGIGHAYGIFRDNALFIEGGDYLSCFRQYGGTQDVYAWPDNPECPELNLTTSNCQFIIHAMNNFNYQSPTVMIDGFQSFIYLLASPLFNDSLTISYQWQLNGVDISGENSPFLSVFTPGNYTVLTNSDECQSAATISITSEPLTIVPSPDVNVCYNQEVCNFFQTSYNHPDTYFSWIAISSSNSNSQPSSGFGQFCYFNFNNLSSIDTVMVIVQPCTFGFCGLADTFFVYSQPQSVNHMPDLSYCQGDSIPEIIFQNYLTNTTQTYWQYQGYVYKDYWGNYISYGNQSDITNGGQDTIPSFESENSSSNLIKYHYFVVNSQDSITNCWNYSDTFNIIIYHKPNVIAGSDQTVCEGNSVVLGGSGAMTYNWNNGVTDGIPFFPTSTNAYVVFGLDSIFGCTNSDTVIVNVVPNSNATSFENITTCSTYSWNGNIFTSSGTYTETFININGCDSTATLNLTINQPNSSSFNIETCGSYTWNGNTYTSSGIFTETFTNVNGCDSIVTLNLTINQPNSSSSDIESCGSYTSNGNSYLSSGTYTENFINSSGCDSTVTLNLTISHPLTTPVISLSSDSTMITIPSQIGAQYQWINCDTGLPILNENDTIFIPDSSGNFAVIISNSCGSDTSECLTASIFEHQNDQFQIYPNPTWNNIFFQSKANFIGQYFEITDFSGRIVQKGKISSEKQEISLENLSSGVYYFGIKNSAIKLKINKL